MLYSLLITIYFLLFGLLAWKNEKAALWLLIFALPTYLIRFSIFNLPATLLEGMIIILFLIWFIKNWKKILIDKNEKTRYPFRWEIIIVLLVSAIAVMISHSSFESLGIWKAYFFEAILVYILVLNIFKEKSPQYIISALAAMAGLISISAIIQKITGLGIANPIWANPETRRIVSIFGYPNAVGLFLAPIMPLFLARAIKTWQTNKKQSIVFIIVFLSSLISIYFAKSDGALIALAFSLFITALIYKPITRKLALSLALIGIVIIIIQPSLFNPLKEKITMKDLSGEIRKVQWQETITMLKDGRIISGAGLAGYQSVLKTYHVDGLFFNKDKDPDFKQKTINSAEYRANHWQPVEIYLYPHNIILNFWTELGLAGVIIFLFIIFKSIYLAIKNIIKNNERELSLGILMAWLIILVHGLVDVPYFKNDLAIIFWLLISLTAYLKLQNENNSPKIHCA
jgi:O-antigen ligase